LPPYVPRISSKSDFPLPLGGVALSKAFGSRAKVFLAIFPMYFQSASTPFVRAMGFVLCIYQHRKALNELGQRCEFLRFQEFLARPISIFFSFELVHNSRRSNKCSPLFEDLF
jgi:hypothetical protein